jgi:hypothetical protein
MLMVCMLISMSCLFYGWEVVGGRWEKHPQLPPPPNPPTPAVGGGRGIIMSLGEEGEYLYILLPRQKGDSYLYDANPLGCCIWVQILEDDLQTFTGIAFFRLVLFVSLSLFSLFEVFRLHANKAKKTIFFASKAKRKKPYFRLFSL